MKKKYSLLLFIAVLGVGLWFFLPFSPFNKRVPADALPFDTPYFIPFRQFPDTTLGAEPYSSELMPSLYWEKTLEHLGILLIDNRKKVLAWPRGWDQPDRHLFIYDMEGTTLPIEQWQVAGGTVTHYKGFSIHHLTDLKGVHLALTQYKNLLLLSQQSLLIEDALRQLSANSMEAGPTLNLNKAWLDNQGANPATFLFHLPYAASFFQQNNAQGLSFFSAFQADWLQVEWLAATQAPAILSAKAQWAPHATSLVPSKHSALRMAGVLGIIPAWADNWEAIQLPDVAATYRRLNEGETDWFSRYITPWVGDHLAWIDLSTIRDKSNVSWLLPCKDSLVAQQSLAALLGEAGELSRVSYQSYELVQGNVDNLFAKWQNDPKGTLQNPWWVQIADYYIFAGDRQSLQQLIDVYLVGQTLLQQELPAPFIAEGSQWLRVLPTPPQWQQGALAAGGSIWLNGTLAAYGMAINGFSYQGNRQDAGYPTIAWRSALAAAVQGAPSVIPTGAQEWRVFAAAENDYLYKLDQQGKIEWQQKLNGPLLSKVQPILKKDAKQISLAFNSSKGLYHVDLQGKTLAPFPLLLDPPATNGLLAVDFHKEGNYQFFLACAEGIFAFSDEGIPLNAWNPLQVSGRFSEAFQHVQNETEDYLIAWNTAGVLYNWKRSTDLHFPPMQLNTGNSPLAIAFSDRQQQIVAVDATGLAQVVNFSGESFSLPLSVGDNTDVKFAFGNFCGDSRADFAVLSGRNLALHYYTEKGFEQKFRQQLEKAPDQVFTVKVGGREKALIGSLHMGSQEISLYDEKGQLLPGFPLAGNTPFDLTPLDEKGHYLLVTGQNEWVIAYRIALF
ncbi:MAG: hypothetical protein R2828_01505 [Saprospiraceae bacterium]